MVARGSITDRKDFYHQAQVSYSRVRTSVTPFAFKQDDFKGTAALDQLMQIYSTKATSRTAQGDRLGLGPRPMLLADDPVYPAFNSLLQGDHLGVEFALSAHAAF